MKKDLPSDLTSYDLLKTLAIVLMLVDHVGYYFFPDENVWRIIGRVCVPLWFFLIGYARTRDLDPRFVIGGGLLVVADFVVGHNVLPLNILFTMFLMRLVLDRATGAVVRGGTVVLWPLGVFLTVATLPSMFLFEYGTQGLVLVLCGWMLRQRQEAGGQAAPIPEFLRGAEFFGFLGFSYITFCIMQGVLFGFTGGELYTLAVGLGVSFTLMLLFRPRTYPGLTRMLGPGAGVLRLTGRRTLEIYVLHLLLFKLLGLLTQPDRFGLFQWSWFSL